MPQVLAAAQQCRHLRRAQHAGGGRFEYPGDAAKRARRSPPAPERAPGPVPVRVQSPADLDAGRCSTARAPSRARASPR